MLAKANISIIYSITNLTEGSKRINIMLPNGIRFYMILYILANLEEISLVFKDIYKNYFHIKTMNEGNVKYLYITSVISSLKLITKKLSTFSFWLYHTTIKSIKSHVIVNQKFNDPKNFILCHNKLGHSGSLRMCEIIKHLRGHPLKNSFVQ